MPALLSTPPGIPSSLFLLAKAHQLPQVPGLCVAMKGFPIGQRWERKGSGNVGLQRDPVLHQGINSKLEGGMASFGRAERESNAAGQL